MSLKKLALDSMEQIHLLALKLTLGVHIKTINLAFWGGHRTLRLLAFESLKLATDYFYRLESTINHAFLDYRSLNLDRHLPGDQEPSHQ